MAKIEWTQMFSTQNEQIDDQHKNWIKIYNDAHEKMMGNLEVEDKNDIGLHALKEMIAYSKYHFSSEEQLMAQVGYRKIDEHRTIHRLFAKKLADMDLKMHQGLYVLNSEIIKTIENWLVDHILNEDKKIFN